MSNIQLNKTAEKFCELSIAQCDSQWPQSMRSTLCNPCYCLFRPVTGGSKQGRKLLIWHSGVTDAETGGQYTLKVYQSQKSAAEDEELQNAQVVLTPLNPDFEPIVLDADDEGAVRAIAEYVRIL